MDYQFQKKLVNETVDIAIVYKEIDYQNANKLKQMIEVRYRDGIRHYQVHPFLVQYKNIKKSRANVYYIFPATKKEILSVIKEADIYSSLTFSYAKEDLKYGVMISLNISKKIRPLLNLESIKKHHIAIRPVLIDISTIYQADIKDKV
jgi:hypothetical protein